MGHCIRAIVASTATADAISAAWPELPRLNGENGFVVFPVDAELIDRRFSSDETPQVGCDEFMLLTSGLRNLLRMLSRGGQLAYVETDYFGGAGGQGALVCRDGDEIMCPTWDRSGTINLALALIGVRSIGADDNFDAVGFGDVRSNDDLLNLIGASSARPRFSV